MIIRPKSTSARGYSLLEYAAVLPVFLFFIIGAVDVTNLMRGYTALQAGVDKTLRCLYPTDAACVQASPDTRARLFEVIHADRPFVNYIPEMNYDGRSEWLNQPIDGYTRGHATILDTGSFEPPPMRAILEDRQGSASGSVHFVVQTYSSPFVSGGPMDPQFGTSNTNGNRGNYPYKHTINISNISRSTTSTGSVGMGIATGKIPALANLDLYKNAPCFKSTNFDQDYQEGAPTENLNNSCQFDPENIPVILHITGEVMNGTNDSAPNAQGKVTISIQTKNAKGEWNTRPLGGRLIQNTPGSNDDFVPRGFTCEEVLVDPTCKPKNECEKKLECGRVTDNIISDPYDAEAAAHGGITLPMDEEFRIGFEIRSETGEKIGWRGEKIDIYMAGYEGVDRPANCLNPILESTITNDQVTCPSDHPTGLPADHLKISGNATALVSDSVDFICGTHFKDIDTILNKRGKADAAKYKREIREGESCVGFKETFPCPEENLGVSDGSAEPGASICNSSEAASVCRTPKSDWDEFGRTPPNICWTQRTEQVAFREFKYPIPDCQNTAPPRDQWPEELLRYKKPFLDAPTARYSQKLCTLPISSEKSPQQIAIDDSRYNCGLFPPGSFDYNERTNPSIPSGSLFKGAHPHLGCSWQEALRRDAESFKNPELKLDKQCYFTASQRMAGRIKTNETHDSCTPVEKEVVDPVEYTNLGTFKENEFPEICNGPDRPCRAEFKGFSDEGQAAETKLLGDKAVMAYGIPEITATFPNARFEGEECQGALCASLKAFPPDSGDDAIVRAEASLKVPIYIGRLFGSEGVSLRYADEVRLEKDFANQK